MSAAGATPDVAALDGPYVGLKPYTQENADIFFGRAREQAVLISNLRASRLTLLHARSGTGKSSLLRASVAVRLGQLAQRSFERRGAAQNIPVVFSSWQDDPASGLIGEIQQAIIPFLPQASRPATIPDQLDRAIEAATKATGATLLVILDQFEDYFLYQSGDTQDRRFADELAACINRADLRAKFLMSIREDAYSTLGDLFNGKIQNVYGNYFHLEPLTREAAREAIERPIASYNERHPDQVPAQIKPDLVEAVLDELTAGLGEQTAEGLDPDPGGTGLLAAEDGAESRRDEVTAPFLQLVMKRLWEEELGSSPRKLRRETLEKLGGAREIISNHADRALANLPAEQRKIATDILLRLVTSSGTKLALPASDLTKRPSSEVDAVLQRLVGSDDRILITVPAPPGRPKATRYEVAHDLLVPTILEWHRYRAARDWERKSNRNERKAQAAEREAQAEKRRARRFRALAIGSALLLVVVILLAAFAGKAEHDAVIQSNTAKSDEMAAEAISLLPANGPLAMLLSLQAYERAPTLRAESALIQAAQQPLDDLLVSGRPVRSVAFSPDGSIMAAGESGGHIGLWNVATGRPIATLADRGVVYGIAFSPDGRTLAAGDLSGRIGLWNVATSKRIASLPEDATVYGVAFSPDGRTLAAGDLSGRIGLWNVSTGKRIASLTEGNPVSGVAFSPDGRTLAVGDTVGDIGLWDVATGRRTATLAEGAAIYGVAFSPDARTLAAGDGGGHVGLWDVATGKRTATLTEGNPASSVAFSPDGQTLAVGDYGGHVGLWDVTTERQSATLAEGNTVYSVAFSPDGQTLAAGDIGGDIGLWDVTTAQRPSRISEGSPVGSVAFSPDGHALAAGDISGHVGLWDVATGKRTATLAEGHTIEGVAFSPDGRTLAAADYDGHVGLWDVTTGKRTATLTEGSLVESVAFSPGGQTLAAGDVNGHVGLWDLATGQRTATLAEGSRVASVAFSPDGHTLAAGDYDGHVGLWDPATGQRIATYTESGAVYSVAFSPDGRILAAGGLGGVVGLWDAATGQLTATLSEGNPVESVAFSPDGPLVTGDSLGNVVIWNAVDGNRLANLVEGDEVTGLAFSPNGSVLAIGGLNGTIVLLRQNLANLTRHYFIQLICGDVQENLTQAQWDDYAPGQPYQQTCP